MLADTLDERHEGRQREDDLRAGIVELMLYLTLAIQRVERRHRRAGEQRAVERDGVLDGVRRIDADDIALAQTFVLQRAGHAFDGRPELAVAVGLALCRHERRLVRETLDRWGD